MRCQTKCKSFVGLVCILFRSAATKQGETNESSVFSRSKPNWGFPTQNLKGMQVTTGSYRIPAKYKRQLHEMRRLNSSLKTGSPPYSVHDIFWFNLGPERQFEKSVVICGTFDKTDTDTSVVVHAYAKYFNQLYEKNQGIRVGGQLYSPELLLMDDLGSSLFASLVSQIMFSEDLSFVTFPCHYYLGTANQEFAPYISAWASQYTEFSSEIVLVSSTWWNSIWLDAWPTAVSVRPKPDLSSAMNLLHGANDVKTVAILYDLHRMNYNTLDAWMEFQLMSGWTLSEIERLIQKNTSSPNWREELGHWPYEACASVLRIAEASNMEVLKYEPLDLEGDQMATIATQAPDLVVTCMGENRSEGNEEARCDLLVQKVKSANLNPKALILTGCAETLYGNWMNTYGGHEARMFLDIEAWSDYLLDRINEKSHLVFDLELSTYNQVMERDSAWQSAMAWAACDLLVHAIEKAGTITDHQAVARALRNITDHDILHPVLGNISFDSRGQNIAPMLVLQYQQAEEGLSYPGQVVSRKMAPDPVIVAPEVYASGPVWYPMPSFDELQCYRNDDLSGISGFNLPNVSYDIPAASLVCAECPPRALSMNVDMEVSINSFQPNSLKNVTVRYCVECAVGTERISVRLESPVMDRYKCQLCAPGYKSSADALSCEHCPAGSYSSSSGASQCLWCVPGRAQRQSGESYCRDCTEGTVSVNSGATACMTCPKGSACNLGSDGLRTEYVSIKGWYILTQDEFDQEIWDSEQVGLLYPSGQPYRCPYHKGEACQGNSKCYTSEGLAHLEGPMCGRCAAGFERQSKLGLCHKCSAYVASIFMALLKALWMMMYIVIILWECLCISTPTGTRQIRVLILKQAMDFSMMYDVIVSLCDGHLPGFGNLNELGYAWSCKPLLDAFVYLYGVRSLPALEVAASCYMQYLYPDTGTHFSYVIFAFLMVPLWLLFSFLGFACFKLATLFLAPKLSRRVSKSSLITLWCITIWFVHFRIVRMLGIALQCESFDVMRLAEDPSLFCWKGEARRFQIVAAIGLVVLGVGLPYVLYLIIRRYRGKDGNLHTEEATYAVGFFHVGYRRDAYYWECTKMGKRAICQLLPLLPVFDSDQGGPSASAILLVPLLMSATWHYILEPYDSRFARIQYRVHNANSCTLFIMVGLNMVLQATSHKLDFLSLKITRPVKDTTIAIFFWGLPLLCHCFMLLALFQSCFVNVALEKRWKGFIQLFSSGSVEVYDHLLGTKGMPKGSRKAFLQIIRDMTLYQLKYHGAINWDAYEQSFQELVLETAYWSELQEVNDNSCLEIRKADQRLLTSLHPDGDLQPKAGNDDDNHVAIRPSRKLLEGSFVTDAAKSLSGDSSADEFYIRALDRELGKMHWVARLKKMRRFRGKRVSLDRMNEVLWEFGPGIIRRVLEKSEKTHVADTAASGISMTEFGIEALGIDAVRAIGFTVIQNPGQSTGQIQTLRLEELEELDADPARVAEREEALKSAMIQLQANITQTNEENTAMRSHVVEHGSCEVAESIRDSLPPRVIEEAGIGITVISVKNLNIPAPESHGSEDGKDFQPKLSVQCLCMLSDYDYSSRTGFTTPAASWNDNDKNHVWDHHTYLPEFKKGDSIEFTIFVTVSDKSAGEQAETAFLDLFHAEGQRGAGHNHARPRHPSEEQHFSDEIDRVDSRLSGKSGKDGEVLGIAVLEPESFFPDGFDDVIQLEDTSGAEAEFVGATLRVKIDPCQSHALGVMKKQEIRIAKRVFEAKEEKRKASMSEIEPPTLEAPKPRLSGMRETQERKPAVKKSTSPGNSINNMGGANLKHLEAEAQHHRTELEELRNKRLQLEESLARTRVAAAAEAAAAEQETVGVHPKPEAAAAESESRVAAGATAAVVATSTAATTSSSAATDMQATTERRAGTATDGPHSEASRREKEVPRAETWEHMLQQRTAGALPSREVLQEQLEKLQAVYTMPLGDLHRLSGDPSARPIDAQLNQPEVFDNEAEASALKEISYLQENTDRAYHELESAKDLAEGLQSEAAMLMKSLLDAGFDVALL